MNLRTKVPAVIWLPLTLMASAALVLVVGLNIITWLSAREIPIRRPSTAPSPSASSATSKQEPAELKTQCNLHFDPSVLPKGWTAASNSSWCVTLGFKTDWYFNGKESPWTVMPKSQLSVGNYAGYYFEPVFRSIAGMEMKNSDLEYRKADGFGSWDVRVTDIHYYGQRPLDGIVRKAIIVSPTGNVYSLVCDDVVGRSDQPCGDFDQMLALIPALNPDQPFLGGGKCGDAVVNGPASLAAGWRWESDVNGCLGVAFPQDWTVSKTVGRLLATKYDRHGESAELLIQKGDHGLGDPYVRSGDIVTVARFSLKEYSEDAVTMNLLTRGEMMTKKEIEILIKEIASSIKTD